MKTRTVARLVARSASLLALAACGSMEAAFAGQGAPQASSGPAAPVTTTPGLPPTGAGESGPPPPLAVVGQHPQVIGRRSPVELISGSFRLRNTGDKPLTITKVEAGCRCTYGVVNNPVVPPGGETTLNYELDLRGTVGPIRKPIRVSVGGYNRSIELVVQGEMQYDIRAEPPTLQADANGEARFTLTSLDGKPFRVLSVQGQAPTVTAKVPAEGEVGLSWSLAVNINRTLPYAVVVETDHPTAPVIDLRVMGGAVAQREVQYFKVINDIAIGRHMVNLGVVKPGATADFDMYITRVKDHGKPVTVATDGGDVKLEVVELGPWRRPDDDHLKLRARFREGVKGTVLFPVYVTSEGKTNRTWACAVVKE